MAFILVCRLLRPELYGFSALRVINDDVIDAAVLVPTRTVMAEILTLLEGAVEHQDSMGNRRAGSGGRVPDYGARVPGCVTLSTTRAKRKNWKSGQI